ncbi:MAG: hypothetical protein UZ22_OP11002000053 [Microgenomates bacterium OLB23]|nr:MAG: hypothetical protein UZ22_OP11002000053 [Microgenomates bacterium OLB23]
MKHKKVAIVYDWIDSWGGAERVLEVFAAMYPTADWYTLVYNRKSAQWAKSFDIQPSFINRLPEFIRANRVLSVPLMPFAVEAINLSSYTHVLSITSAFAKAVITRPETRHVSYILSPPRFLWSHQRDYGTASTLMRPYINYLRNWDYIGARRPDMLIAVSPEVAQRIKKILRLRSKMLYCHHLIHHTGKTCVTT